MAHGCRNTRRIGSIERMLSPDAVQKQGFMAVDEQDVEALAERPRRDREQTGTRCGKQTCEMHGAMY